MEAFAASPQFPILETSDAVHAIFVPAAGIRVFNFRQDIAITSNDVSCDRIASMK
jgi:hypothetical protein